MSILPHECYFTDAVAEVKGFSIFMLDTEGIIKTWNQGCQQMKGYTAEEAIGQNFEMLFPELLREQKLHETERQLAKENGRYEVENWRMRKDGELFWAHVVLTPIHDDKGEHIGFVKITQDQTDKKRYLEQLNENIEQRKLNMEKLDRLNNELRRSNATLEEFAYASSHDLQAPLRKISVVTGRLKNELWERLDNEQRESFERVGRSTKRMFDLIKDLLDYSQINNSTGEAYEVDLNLQVKDVLEELQEDSSKEIRNFDIGLLPTVSGNRQQLQQLFQNLISNSLKYMKPGEIPVIKISANQVRGHEIKHLPVEVANKYYHLIEVKDNGIGFEQKFAEDIFKVFTRLETGSNYTGSGIGLSIVKKVVDNHQGYVWAESQPGEGASFKMLFPVAKFN